MKPYSVVIAVGAEDLREALKLQFHSFCRVSCCGSGREALETVSSLRPDVLVLDLMLPELDGLSVLENLSALGLQPGILAVSAYVSPYILSQAESLGVSCLMELPLDLPQAENKICELLRQREAGSFRDRYGRISGILLSLGFASKLRGYAYLREAVLYLADLQEPVRIIEIYRHVGIQYGVAAEDVEHSIRSAAAEAWQHRKGESWGLYFPSEKLSSRPSNVLLITGLADCIRGSRTEEPLQSMEV